MTISQDDHLISSGTVPWPFQVTSTCQTTILLKKNLPKGEPLKGNLQRGTFKGEPSQGDGAARVPFSEAIGAVLDVIDKCASDLITARHRLRQPGQSEHLPAPKRLGGAEAVECQVTTGRLEEDSFLILAGREVDPESMLDLYRKRWEILAFFAALKSRGFGLEETHMTGPNRIRKLLGILALTYSWTRIIGLDRKAKEGAPRECANGYPEKSLFLLWTGSSAGAYGQLAPDRRQAAPVYSGTHRSSLIFVV